MNTRVTAYVVCVVGIVVSTACTTSSTATYAEQDDATNNWNVGGTPEDTGLTLGATGSITVDGEVNSGHFDTEDLDNDTYTFKASAQTTATITLTGSDAKAALVTFRIAVLDSALFGQGDVEVGAPSTVHLLPGTYYLEVHAQNPTPIATSYPYTIAVTASGGS